MKMNFKKLIGCGALSLLFAVAPLTTHAARAEVVRPAAAQMNGNALAGTEWVLDSPTYAGLEKAPVLKFSDSQLNASVGLNSIFGGYTVDENKIMVKPLASTKMAGPESEMQAEMEYAKVLQNVRSFAFSLNGQSLVLHGDKTLTFRLANNATQTMRNTLAWTEWTLDSPTYSGLEKAPVLLFSETQVHASVGLNSLFGGYMVDGQNINVQPLASTKMAGPEPTMRAENRYAEALQSVQSFEFFANGDRLTLHGNQDLTFHVTNTAAQTKQNALAGTDWTLDSPAYAGLSEAPVLKFTDSRLGASVGLNSIFGGYSIYGNGITIEPLASTKMAGPKSLMQAENRYAKALQGVRSFEVFMNGDRLTLRGDQTLTFHATKEMSSAMNNALAGTE